MYRIDREAMTIEQLWQYGKERGEEFFSSYIGNVEWYGEDHYLVHSGGIQYYGEHASEKPAALLQGDPNVRAESITVESLLPYFGAVMAIVKAHNSAVWRHQTAVLLVGPVKISVTLDLEEILLLVLSGRRELRDRGGCNCPS